MKRIILSIIIATGLFVGCTNDDDEFVGGSFNDPTGGWVEFNPLVFNAAADFNVIAGTVESIDIPVSMIVPVNTDGTQVFYTLTEVSGDLSTITTETNRTLMYPANTAGVRDISIPIPLDHPGGVSFDVTLTGTSKANVTAGLTDGSKITTVRVNVCRFEAGDYTLEVTTGNGAFGAPQFNSPQTVALTNNNGVFSFSAVYLEALGIGQPASDFDFTVDNGVITLLADVSGFIGCGGGPVMLSQDPDNASVVDCANNAFVFNLLDFTGGSGGCGPEDEPFTMTLIPQ
ncbi:MAG: hypothetical protein RQ756_02845 [Flavobacteriaceae bacterium]|nr:hypothetical protein [Flavobacteriaceae bacterium]